jgi:hypothetical protein
MVRLRLTPDMVGSIAAVAINLTFLLEAAKSAYFLSIDFFFMI